MKGWLALVKTTVRSSFRNRAALIFTLLIPIFLMVLLGNVLGGGNASVNIGVVNNSLGTLSKAYIATLQHDKNLVVEQGSASHESSRLQHDDVVAIVVIAPGFGTPPCPPGQRCIANGVDLQLDANDPSDSQIAEQVINAITQDFALTHKIGGTPGIAVATTEVGTQNVTTIDYYLPSMMAYVAVLAGLTYVSITIVDQRERKVLRRYRATPLHPLQVLGAAMTGGAITVALEVVALALVGVFIFGAHGHGSWLLAAVALVFGIASFVSIGFLLTSFVSTSDAARGISSLIGFPMLFLSGIFFPVDALPQWIQDIVHVLPVYYVSDALHQILNAGTGLPLIDIAVPLAWAVGCFALASWRFRWE
jgi:ABC-2 type transport system permease protein